MQYAVSFNVFYAFFVQIFSMEFGCTTISSWNFGVGEIFDAEFR